MQKADKQTVKEAADAYKQSKANFMCPDAFLEGFHDGAEWQKSQGIAWIEPTEDNLPYLGEPVLIYLSTHIWLKGRRMIGKDGIAWTAYFSNGEQWLGDIKVTHFAHINNP